MVTKVLKNRKKSDYKQSSSAGQIKENSGQSLKQKALLVELKKILTEEKYESARDVLAQARQSGISNKCIESTIQDAVFDLFYRPELEACGFYQEGVVHKRVAC